MTISPLAGKPADPSMLVDVPALLTAYYTQEPDPRVPAQRVAFGTSGHRGSSLERAFNEWHILAISQAICFHRKRQQIDGPLFLGLDTHALSVPALASALEVRAANGVEVMLAEGDEYTPTPAISHAILTHNRGRKTGLADGIVITPSHNPPHDGGFKYNPPNGGPADLGTTDWIGARANELLEAGLAGVKRIRYETALHAPTTHRHDYVGTYVGDLGNVIDMDAIRGSKISLGMVSSQLIDRVAAKLGRKLHEVPVGFKWFVDGLLDGSLGFGGEESAGASFLRLEGGVWTTDKDGIAPALLSGEITARMGRDPGELYCELTRELGEPVYDRVEAKATPAQKAMLERLSPQQIHSADLAGEKIQSILTQAPGNGAPLGGVKVIAENGWFAARPSGTEEIYKIYGESFRGAEHLRRILEEAQAIVDEVVGASSAVSPTPLEKRP
jgi:phosphoglucomutase